ncbi:DUF4214 domain-containing protein [Homoserinibacter sp. GY 40078]|uniref:DUF4214 domain-containing protein n=1 Tax=Homoserinibacter sp. GY 40078 TaxID=2603275 RepID=UPI0011C74F82|nr:DUF4214 domain-containing protein [Homoserinibacter sp. GY 40078]TXK16325.1 DUF4214 domain-containing protein [Homoserinibacter sp. GY 40078]
MTSARIRAPRSAVRAGVIALAAMLMATLLQPAAAHADPTQHLKGRVGLGVASAYAGAGDVKVSIRERDAAESASSVLTDEEGRFEFGDLEGDTVYVLSFDYLGDDSFMRTYAPSTTYWPSGTERQITIPVAHRLGGSVLVGLDRTPATEGQVRVTLSSSAGSTPRATTYTDASGRYLFDRATSLTQGYLNFEVVDDPSYPVWYYAGAENTGSRFSKSAVRLQFSGDRTDLDTIVGDGSVISGVVRDSSGAPVSGITVYANERPNGGTGEERQVDTDADGAFVFRSTTPGRYRVFTSMGVYAQVQGTTSDLYHSDVVEVAPQTAVALDFTAYLASTLRGKVTGNRDLLAAYGPLVVNVLYRSPGTSTYTAVRVDEVDSAGAFTFNYLQPGTYRIDTKYLSRSETRKGKSFAIAEGSDITVATLKGPDIALPADLNTYLTALYTDFLGRKPGRTEILNWHLKLWVSPNTKIVPTFANSDEYRLIRIDAAYQDILGRKADKPGRSNWLKQMQRGRITTDDIERQFYSSAEYEARARLAFPSATSSKAAFVMALYRDLLGRKVDSAGLAAWTNRALKSGNASVVKALWGAPEVARSRVADMYRHYLLRTPDPTGLKSWTKFILKHGDTATRATLTQSSEYYNLSGRRFPEMYNAYD